MKPQPKFLKLLWLPTVVFLLLGSFLVWASQSWYALVWAQARAAFPGEGTRVLMVNTAATFPRRAKYLPEEFQHNIALRAVVVDKNERVRAIVYRSADLTLHPERKERIDTWYYSVRANSWAEACLPIRRKVCDRSEV